MASVIVAIVDGVRSLLQTEMDANGFVRQFTPERNYQDQPLKETDSTLHVDVVHAANEITITSETRGTIRYTVPINIGIRKRLEPKEQDSETGDLSRDDLDELTELTEQICEFFAPAKVLSNNAVSLGPATITTVAPENYLREHGQFLGIVRVTFQHSKVPT